MKHLVETRGSYMLMDPYTGCIVPAGRPAVVEFSAFIETRVANRQLRILGADIDPKTTDEDFVAYWRENTEIAVDAFLSEFGRNEVDYHGILEAAFAQIGEADLQKDGKPKVGALAKLVDAFKVDTQIRDEWWEARG